MKTKNLKWHNVGLGEDGDKNLKIGPNQWKYKSSYGRRRRMDLRGELHELRKYHGRLFLLVKGQSWLAGHTMISSGQWIFTYE